MGESSNFTGSSSSGLGMNWDPYAPNWKSLLEEQLAPPNQINYREVTDYDQMKKFDLHAAHIMLWCHAKDTDVIIGKYPLQYRIIMQIRFDGRLGFPGGEIDELANFDYSSNDYEAFLDTIKVGLIREVREEMELELKNTPKYIFSSVPIPGQAVTPRDKSIILHFFCAEVSLETMESMENNLSKILSNDEVLGLTRVPLYLMWDGKRIRGLPTFLTNAFAGNSSDQLMRACVLEGLLTDDQVRVASHLALRLGKKV